MVEGGCLARSTPREHVSSSPKRSPLAGFGQNGSENAVQTPWETGGDISDLRLQRLSMFWPEASSDKVPKS